MPVEKLRRSIGLVLVALLGFVSACGGGSDGRDRNVKMVTGQACQKLGETTTVSKVLNVCGRNGADLVWYAAVSTKPKGEKCTRPGGFKQAKGKPQVCGVVKKQRIWIDVAPLPVVALADSTSSESTVPGAESGPTTTVVPTNDPATSTTMAVTPSSTVPSSTNSTVPSMVGQSVEAAPPADAKVAAASLPAVALKVVAAPTEARNGQVLSSPIVVQVATAGGEARKVPGVTVSITSLREDVTIAGRTAITDANGRATFDEFKMVGPVEPSNVVALEITANDLASTGVSLTLRPGTAVRLMVISHGSTTVAGDVFPDVVRVVALDQGDVQVPGAGVVVKATDSTTKKEVGTATTNDAGEAVFDRLILTRAGAARLAFASGNLAGDSFSLTVLPAVAAGVEIVTPPTASMRSGIESTDNPRIRLVDQYGNPVERAGVRITATLADATAGDKATLSKATATTGADGKATFEGFALAGSAGRYAIEFSMGTGTVTAVTEVELGGGVPTAIEVVSAPTEIRSGQVPQVPLSVRLVDRWKNPVAAKGVSISASSDASVRMSDASATTADDGLATFDSLVIRGDVSKVPTLTLTFGAGDLTAASIDVTLLSGYATRLVFLSHQQVVLSGKKFTIPTKLLAVDDDGFAAPDPQSTVFGSCGGAPVATVTTDANGVATFSPSVLDGDGWNSCRYLFAPAIGGASSYTMSIYVAAKTSFTAGLMVSPPSTATNDAPFADKPEILVTDPLGLTSVEGVSVRARIAEQPAAGAQLAGDQATTDANGRAVFNRLAIRGKAGRYVLEFSVNLGASVQSNVVTLRAGAGGDFVITRDPGEVANRQAFGVAPILQLVDGGGNPTSIGNFKAKMTIPGGSSITATPNTNGQFIFSGANTDNAVVTGNVGVVTPTYSLLDAQTSSVLSTKSGSPFLLRPGAFASVSIDPPTSVESGTPVPAFDLLDVDGNVIDEPILLSISYSYMPKAGSLTWMSGSRQLLVEAGRADFGAEAVLHGLLGSELKVYIFRLHPGRPEPREQLKSFNVKISGDPLLGEIGPAGGRIIYKSQTVLDKFPPISDGGRFLELAPSWWESTPTVRRFAKSVPNYVFTDYMAGAGAQNTATLIDALNDPESVAAVAANLDMNNFVDWFLPTTNELSMMDLVGIEWGEGTESSVTSYNWFWTSTVNVPGAVDVILMPFMPRIDKVTQVRFTPDGSWADTSERLLLLRPVRAFG